MAILITRVASAKEIAQELGIGIPAASHHIRELHKDGVLEFVKSETGGQRRGGAEQFYRATALPEVTEADWLKMPGASRRQMAGRVLQAIIALSLSAMRCQTMEEDDHLHLAWQEIPVDDQGEQELAELLAETSRRATEIKAEAKARLADSADEGRVRVVANMGFWLADPGSWAGRHAPAG